jgi:hypothetical protein
MRYSYRWRQLCPLHGEQFGGGVFFICGKTMPVLNMFNVALTDQSTSQVWSNVSSTEFGASGQSSWAGLSNSNAIVGQAGHTSSAAKLCLDLESNGQSDWYLPGILELKTLYNNYYTVARAFSQIPGATQLTSTYYWSSSEGDSFYSLCCDFGGGLVSLDRKDLPFYVRAVRAF